MEKSFAVEISARHIHLCKEDLEKLFGPNYELTPKKELSQPGQYACEEKVTIVGAKGQLKASILGPIRKASQVELSLTDARTVGVTALIRESGDIEGTSGVKLVGPYGEVELEKGVIAAKRHIHMTNEDAQNFGVKNGDIVAVEVKSEQRSLVFKDTVVRVSDSYALAMHIDTDEANAAGISCQASGVIVK